MQEFSIGENIDWRISGSKFNHKNYHYVIARNEATATLANP